MGFAGVSSCEEGIVREDAALEGEHTHQSLSLRYSVIAKASPALLSSSPPALTNRFISALLRAPHIAAARPGEQNRSRSILSAAALLLHLHVFTDASRAAPHRTRWGSPAERRPLREAPAPPEGGRWASRLFPAVSRRRLPARPLAAAPPGDGGPSTAPPPRVPRGRSGRR